MSSDTGQDNFTEQIVEQLAKANEYLLVLGPISAMFSSTIRSIRKAEIDATLDQTALDQFACNSAFFLVNVSPTLKAIFFRAAEQLHPNVNLALSPLTTRTLLAVFRAREVSCILTLAYYSRQIKRKIDSHCWERFSPELYNHIQIGSLIGQTINHVGSEYGMLNAGLTWLAALTFATSDSKAFEAYIRQNEKRNVLFNSANELKRWGCTNQTVAAQMCLNMGYGKHLAQNILFDYSKNLLQDSEPERAEEFLCWHVAREITQSFDATGEPPKDHSLGELLTLPESDSEELARKISIIKERTSPSFWLNAAAQDLPDEVIQSLQIKVRAAGESQESTFEGD